MPLSVTSDESSPPNLLSEANTSAALGGSIIPKKLQAERWDLVFAPGANRGRHARGQYSRGKENLPRVRIFYWGSRRKTEDLDVACVWRERTRN
jgi:hypothetical protein